jgi:hypothetical protein
MCICRSSCSDGKCCSQSRRCCRQCPPQAQPLARGHADSMQNGPISTGTLWLIYTCVHMLYIYMYESIYTCCVCASICACRVLCARYKNVQLLYQACCHCYLHFACHCVVCVCACSILSSALSSMHGDVSLFMTDAYHQIAITHSTTLCPACVVGTPAGASSRHHFSLSSCNNTSR